MTEKFIKKYMRFAHLVGSDQNPCLSRGIGSVIVDPVRNKIVSTGYNGPARGVPHMDSYAALYEFIYPQLTDEDKANIRDGKFLDEQIKLKYKNILSSLGEVAYEGFLDRCVTDKADFANTFEGCKTCPRKLINARSGERLDLCGCAHSERNAVTNAGCSTEGMYIFCYCGVPCIDCSSTIINAGIKKVYCLTDDSGAKDNVYHSWRSEWKFRKASVEVIKLSKEWIHSDEVNSDV